MSENAWFQTMPQSRKAELATTVYSRWMKQGRELYSCMLDADVLAAIYEQMTVVEQWVLETIILKHGFCYFTYETFIQSSHARFANAEIKLALLRLRQKGVVAVMKKMWGERIYYLPRDSFASWHQILLQPPHFSARRSADMTEMANDHEEAIGLDRALFRLLQSIDRNGLHLTKQGNLPQRMMQRLEAHCTLSEASYQSLQLPIAREAPYSRTLAILLDFAFYFGLIAEDDRRWHKQEEAITSWFAQTAKERHHKLMKRWEQIFILNESWFQHAIEGIRHQPVNEWFSLRQLLSWLSSHEQISMPAIDDAITVLWSVWLLPSAENGWFKLTEDDGEKLVMKLDVVEQEVDEFIITDDFEIHVPPHVRFTLRQAIERFCELAHDDVWSRYRLTKKSVHQAMKSGMKGTEILRCLESGNNMQLPHQIRHVLIDWIESFRKVEIVDVTLLRCHTKEIADQIMRSQKLCSFIIQRLNDTTFMINQPRESVGELHSELQRLGYEPLDQRGGKKEPMKQETKHKAKQNHIRQTGLFHVNLPQFQHEHAIPSIQDLYPDLSAIPRSWMQKMGDYHVSTRKALIQKAIEYGALILIKRGLIVPMKLTERDNQWQLHAMTLHGEVVLPPEDCQQLQLILPGINDTTEMIPST